ncbi:MAG: DNA-binding protein WhiA [Lachnospiraceae bacterium]|nr:DNA-binding protein WhiA [Lachnospiraceae bacterium]
MSFSANVKEELSGTSGHSRHCQIAELQAIFTLCGGISISTRDQVRIRIRTENVYVVRKFALLARTQFGIFPQVRVTCQGRKNAARSYTAAVRGHADSLKILRAVDLITPSLDIRENLQIEGNEILRRDCCRRAFLRGAFLACGSISDPNKSYHMEIVCPSGAKAEQIRELIRYFELDPKIVQRKGSWIVYLKEGAQIVDMLNVFGAHQCLMELENIRILREISNHVNRKVNCETANISKTVTAACKQAEDIRYIQAHGGLGQLPQNLQETAYLRLEEPDMPLAMLGEIHQPPIGKSGVNHRLRKISEIADQIRSQTMS